MSGSRQTSSSPKVKKPSDVVRRGPKYAALYHHAHVDLYGRSIIVRTLLQLLIGAYLLLVLMHPRKHVEGDNTNTDESRSNASTTNLMYESPEGLLMTLSAPLPPALLSLHFWAAVLLVGACLLQKHVAMALWDKWQPKKATQYLATRYTDPELRLLHSGLGHATLLFIVLMAYAGFMLQESSTFRNVENVMVLFVAPWGLFVVGMLVTITYDMWLTHAVLGDAIFKGSCIAVPLTRVLTAFLQSPPTYAYDAVFTFVHYFEMEGVGPKSSIITGTTSEGVAVEGISLDTAYYVAIGVASIVVGVWLTAEVIGLVIVSRQH